MNQDKQEQSGTPAQQPFVPMAKQPSGKKHNVVLIIVLSVVGVVVAVAAVISSVVLSSLDDARNRARQANVRMEVQSTLPALLLCADMGGVMYPPKDGGPICASLDYTWPALAAKGASWGGCNFMADVNVADSMEMQLQYCVTLEDRSVITCTDNGCSVPVK